MNIITPKPLVSAVFDCNRDFDDIFQQSPLARVIQLQAPPGREKSAQKWFKAPQDTHQADISVHSNSGPNADQIDDPDCNTVDQSKICEDISSFLLRIKSGVPVNVHISPHPVASPKNVAHGASGEEKVVSASNSELMPGSTSLHAFLDSDDDEIVAGHVDILEYSASDISETESSQVQEKVMEAKSLGSGTTKEQNLNASIPLKNSKRVAANERMKIPVPLDAQELRVSPDKKKSTSRLRRSCRVRLSILDYSEMPGVKPEKDAVTKAPKKSEKKNAMAQKKSKDALAKSGNVSQGGASKATSMIKRLQKPKAIPTPTMTLDKWVMKQIDTGGQRCLVVEGHIVGKANDSFWQTSNITATYGTRKLQTSSGKVYLLRGLIDKQEAQQLGWSSSIIKTFMRGFPANWHELVNEADSMSESSLEDRGKRRSERKGKPLDTPVTRPHRVAHLAEGEGTPTALESRNLTALKMSKLPTTRSGRRVVPQLAWWTGQRVMYDSKQDTSIIVTESTNLLSTPMDREVHDLRREALNYRTAIKTEDKKTRLKDIPANCPMKHTGKEMPVRGRRQKQKQLRPRNGRKCKEKALSAPEKEVEDEGLEVSKYVLRKRTGKQRKEDIKETEWEVSSVKKSDELKVIPIRGRGSSKKQTRIRETKASKRNNQQHTKNESQKFRRKQRKLPTSENEEGDFERETSIKCSGKDLPALKMKCFSKREGMRPRIQRKYKEKDLSASESGEEEGIEAKNSPSGIDSEHEVFFHKIKPRSKTTSRGAQSSNANQTKIALSESDSDDDGDKTFTRENFDRYNSAKSARNKKKTSLRNVKKADVHCQNATSLKSDILDIINTSRTERLAKNKKVKSTCYNKAPNKHPTKVKRGRCSQPEENDAESSRLALQANRRGPDVRSKTWTAAEERRLSKAVASTQINHPVYWEQIAFKVKSRTALECETFMNKVSTAPTKPAKEKPKDTKTAPLSRAGTLKRKVQLREYMDTQNKNGDDDFFNATPFRSKASKKTVQSDIDDSFDTSTLARFETPGLPEKFTPSVRYSWMGQSDKSGGQTPAGSIFTPGVQSTVDRYAADKYIYRTKFGARHHPRSEAKTVVTETPRAPRTKSFNAPSDIDPSIFKLDTISDAGDSEEEDFYFSS